MTALFFFFSPETEPTSAGPGSLPFLFLLLTKLPAATIFSDTFCPATQ